MEEPGKKPGLDCCHHHTCVCCVGRGEGGSDARRGAAERDTGPPPTHPGPAQLRALLQVPLGTPTARLSLRSTGASASSSTGHTPAPALLEGHSHTHWHYQRQSWPTF